MVGRIERRAARRAAQRPPSLAVQRELNRRNRNRRRNANRNRYPFRQQPPPQQPPPQQPPPQDPGPPVPDQIAPAGQFLGMDVMRHIMLRCDVLSLVRFRGVSPWFNHQTRDLRFVQDFRAINRDLAGDVWTVTHHRGRNADNHGRLRMVKHDRDGNMVEVRTVSFRNNYRFIVDRFVSDNERMTLIYVCRQVMAFRLKRGEHLVGLLVFDLLNVNRTHRLLCTDPRFSDNSFNEVNSQNFRIVVENNRYYFQYFEQIGEDLFYFQYVVGLGGQNGWTIHQVQAVEELLEGERDHPLSMASPTSFITFRGDNPVFIQIAIEVIQNHLAAIDHPTNFIGGTFHCIGSSRYMFILDAIRDDVIHSHFRMQGLSLHRLNPPLNAYEQVGMVPHELLLQHRERFGYLGVYTMDGLVCFAVTLSRHQSSGYIIYCYHTDSGIWTRLLDDTPVRNHSRSPTFVANLML